MIDRLCIAHGGDLSEPSGGTDRVSAIASGLNNRGFDVTLVAPEPNGQPVAQLNDISMKTVEVPTHGVTSQPRRAFEVTRKAKEVSQSENTLLQFEHSTLAGVGALRGCKGYVLDMHDFAFRSPLYGDLPLGSLVQQMIGRIEGRGVRRADEIIVVSDAMKKMVIEHWNVPRGRISVVPNGYFEDRIVSHRNRESIEGRVTFLGTLHPKLDIDSLLNIAQLPEVEELIIIGDGNKREEVERASEKFDEMEVTGRLPDDEAFNLVSSSSVVVNPQHESDLQATSSPVKIGYYAALGVPIVTTSGPDLANELEYADAGVVVPPNGDFVGEVQRLLNDRAKRLTLATNAQSLASSWKWEERIQSIVPIYQ